MTKQKKTLHIGYWGSRMTNKLGNDKNLNNAEIGDYCTKVRWIEEEY